MKRNLDRRDDPRRIPEKTRRVRLRKGPRDTTPPNAPPGGWPVEVLPNEGDKRLGFRRVEDRQGRGYCDAFVAKTPNGEYVATVSSLYVDPKHRNKGVGETLAWAMRESLSADFPDLVHDPDEPEIRTYAVEGPFLRVGGGRVLLSFPDETTRAWLIGVLESFGVQRREAVRNPSTSRKEEPE